VAALLARVRYAQQNTSGVGLPLLAVEPVSRL
jgi:hypothetical protein